MTALDERADAAVGPVMNSPDPPLPLPPARRAPDPLRNAYFLCAGFVLAGAACLVYFVIQA